MADNNTNRANQTDDKSDVAKDAPSPAKTMNGSVLLVSGHAKQVVGEEFVKANHVEHDEIYKLDFTPEKAGSELEVKAKEAVDKYRQMMGQVAGHLKNQLIPFCIVIVEKWGSDNRSVNRPEGKLTLDEYFAKVIGIKYGTFRVWMHRLRKAKEAEVIRKQLHGFLEDEAKIEAQAEAAEEQRQQQPSGAPQPQPTAQAQPTAAAASTPSTPAKPVEGEIVEQEKTAEQEKKIQQQEQRAMAAKFKTIEGQLAKAKVIEVKPDMPIAEVRQEVVKAVKELIKKSEKLPEDKDFEKTLRRLVKACLDMEVDLIDFRVELSKEKVNRLRFIGETATRIAKMKEYNFADETAEQAGQEPASPAPATAPTESKSTSHATTEGKRFTYQRQPDGMYAVYDRADKRGDKWLARDFVQNEKEAMEWVERMEHDVNQAAAS